MGPASQRGRGQVESIDREAAQEKALRESLRRNLPRPNDGRLSKNAS